MELQNITRLSPVNGSTLNVEEMAGLEVAFLKRKLEENLSGKLLFWGKIYGSTQDYLVAFHIDPFAEFPDKIYFYCSSSDYVLRALPELNKEYLAQAEKITSAFTGDASFFAFNGEETEEEQQDPEAPPVERFREVHRLSYTVKKIDRDCALVPRGALQIDATKRVILNPYFQGLSYQTAAEPRAYMHFRRPENPQAIALLKKPGIVKVGDFLDSIDTDEPKKIWSIDHSSNGTIAFARNHYWSGYAFYAVLNSSEYGGAYFGTGVPNYDIAFML